MIIWPKNLSGLVVNASPGHCNIINEVEKIDKSYFGENNLVCLSLIWEIWIK